MRLARLLTLLLALFLGACATLPYGGVTSAERAAMSARMMVDIETLASDDFAGRKPGTPGGEKTVEYLTQRFAEVGLTSGTNDPGSPWLAPVELMTLRFEGGSLELVKDGKTIALTNEEAVLFTNRTREVAEGSQIIYVGGRISEIAPEIMAGKLVLSLKGARYEPKALFEKFSAAPPAAILEVVETPEDLARYASAIGKDQMGPVREETQLLGGYATTASMGRIWGEERWETLLAASEEEDFQPVTLDGTANIEARAIRREFTTYNVIGKLPGARPEAGAVMLVAHWDHLGLCGPEDAADRICNGAQDNASGVALMLELGRRLADAGPFERDIYVLATSAEELGLLGAQAFVENPPMPLDSIVAAFNFDTVALAPRGSPVGFVGEGRTSLDEIILNELLVAGRDLGDRDYAERFVQRQDAWALLQKGVPAVLLSSAFASEITAGPFFSGVYHSPSDEAQGIDLGGAIDDLLLHEALVKRLANPSAADRPARR